MCVYDGKDVVHPSSMYQGPRHEREEGYLWISYQSYAIQGFRHTCIEGADA